MNFYVKRGGDSLCYSCNESRIFEDDRGRERVFCYAHHPDFRRITGSVVRCNKYEPVGTMSEFEMQKIAWTVELKRRQDRLPSA